MCTIGAACVFDDSFCCSLLVGVLILFVLDSFGLFFDGGGGDVIIRLSVRISVTMILLLL